MLSKLNSNGNDEHPRSRFNLTCDLNEPLQREHWIHENETNVLEIEYNEHRPRTWYQSLNLQKSNCCENYKWAIGIVITLVIGAGGLATGIINVLKYTDARNSTMP